MVAAELAQDGSVIVTTLVERGYAHATATGTVEVNRDTRQADVRITVDPGPLVHFGKTRIEGLSRIPASAVLARLTYREGERFDPAKLQATQGRLYKLGVFTVVRIHPYDRR